MVYINIVILNDLWRLSIAIQLILHLLSVYISSQLTYHTCIQVYQASGEEVKS